MQNRNSVNPILFKLAKRSCDAFSETNLKNKTDEEKKELINRFPFFEVVSPEKARILFDPKLGFNAYKKFWKKDIFNELKSQYPNGVEIFVETSLNDLSIKQEEKNQFHRFVARRLLEKIEQSACQIIDSHFENLNGKFKNIKKRNAYIEKIKDLRNQFFKDILTLQRGYFFNPLKTLLNDFEIQLATLICNFKDPSTLHTREDAVDELKPYLDGKRIQFKQALTELKNQQFKTFTPGGKLLESDSGFSSDILIIQPEIDSTGTWTSKAPTTYSFYKRHYQLTKKQKKEIQYQGNQTVPSASSHTPHPMLPNYAEVEHGKYHHNKEGKLEITKTISYARCGSSAPVMYYKQKNHDPHKARYSTYLNMQQQMMLSGVKLKSQDSGFSRRLDPTPVIHLHNHLITPTGAGSYSENQKDQYRDMRLMAYAINATLNSDNTAHSSKNQYLYFCQGVNWARKNHSNDTKDTQIKNNKRVLVELFLQSKIVPTEKLNNLDSYLSQLKKVEDQAKIYFDRLENYQNLKKEAQKISSDINILKKSNVNPSKMVNILDQKNILNNLLNTIQTEKTELDKDWDQLRKSEKTMLTQSEKVFQELNDTIKVIIQLSQTLIEKLFSLIFILFKDAESEKYNGLMPALMQLLISELNQQEKSNAVFSGSVGCKSNNDRTVLVASIIRELSFVIAQNKINQPDPSKKSAHDASKNFSENKLELDKLIKLVDKAQKNYLKTGSHYLCMADGSGLPKTAPSLLPHADQKQLKHDGKFGNLAPHKRKSELKDTRFLIEKSMDLDLMPEKKEEQIQPDQTEQTEKENPAATEQKDKTHLSLFNRIQENLPDIDSDWFPIWEQLRRYQANTQFEDDTKRYKHLSLIKQKFKSHQDYLGLCFSGVSTEKYHQIYAEIHLEMSRLALCDERKIKTFISEINTFLQDKSDKSSGKGKKAMISVIENKDSSPAQKLYELQKIAATRKNDWTAWFGNRFGFFQDQRSSKLQKLYETIMNFEPGLIKGLEQKSSDKISETKKITEKPKSPKTKSSEIIDGSSDNEYSDDENPRTGLGNCF